MVYDGHILFYLCCIFVLDQNWDVQPGFKGLKAYLASLLSFGNLCIFIFFLHKLLCRRHFCSSMGFANIVPIKNVQLFFSFLKDSEFGHSRFRKNSDEMFIQYIAYSALNTLPGLRGHTQNMQNIVQVNNMYMSVLKEHLHC